MEDRAGTDSGATRRAVSGRSNGRVAALCSGLVIAMLGLAYAAVPLYRMFCQATGFAGTPMRAEKAPDHVLDRLVTVRFDRTIGPGLSWTVEPVVNTMTVRLGEPALAFYRASNTTDHPVRGVASFNVTPDQAGAFFNKMECFCFKEQELAPGETVEMPVSFFVDPAMLADRDGRYIEDITLSYTFHPLDDRKGSSDKAASVSAPPKANTGKGS